IVDDFGDFGIFVAFAVDDVAPVAPDGADVEEDGLVFRFGAGESSVGPFVPIDGLVSGGAEVGRGGSFEASFGGQGQPFVRAEDENSIIQRIREEKTLRRERRETAREGHGDSVPWRLSKDPKNAATGGGGGPVWNVRRSRRCASRRRFFRGAGRLRSGR